MRRKSEQQGMTRDTPPPRRLVVRVKLISKGPPRAPVRWRSTRGALLLVLGAVAVLLSWVGISMYRSDPASAPVPAPREVAAVVSEQLPKPAAETAATKSAKVEPK